MRRQVARQECNQQVRDRSPWVDRHEHRPNAAEPGLAYPFDQILGGRVKEVRSRNLLIVAILEADSLSWEYGKQMLSNEIRGSPMRNLQPLKDNNHLTRSIVEAVNSKPSR